MTRMSYNWLSREGTVEEAHRRANSTKITQYVYRGGTGYRIQEKVPDPTEAVEYVKVEHGNPKHEYVDTRTNADRQALRQRAQSPKYTNRPTPGPEILDI